MPDQAQPTLATRRQFLRQMGALGAGLALPKMLQAAPAPRQPNIILVLLDDLGYGQFGPNSDTFTLDQLNPIALERARGKITPAAALATAQKAVPNISRLAAEGTRFTDAYVTSSLCAPSRTALMTARYPQTFGFYNNIDVSKLGVSREVPFLVQSLQRGGYATAAIGKWHLARIQGGMAPGTGQHPLDRGFDYFFGFNNHGTEYYDSEILWRDRAPAKAEGYLTEQFTREALGFIERAKGKPFFLYLAYNAVHGPLNRPAPAKYLARFNSGEKSVDNYYAYLNAADEGIGQIRQALEARGQAENTVIFVMSDNGAPGGTPLPSNGPFLGFKGQVWQGGLRVPLLAWGPGRVPAGKVNHDLVSSMDIMPTALELAGAGLPQPEALDGRSLLPLLQGRQQGPVHEALFCAGALADKWAGKGQIADELTAPPAWGVRKGRWLLRYWSHLKRHELYDLETDKGERHDVAADHPEVVSELLADYARWFKRTGKPVAWPEPQWQLLAPAGKGGK